MYMASLCVTGPGRRFKRICELIQSMLLSNRGQTSTPARRISSDMCSDSSSSSYGSIDRVSPTPPTEPSADVRPLSKIFTALFY